MFYDALQLFYEAFPKYNKLPLHIFGESFGGRMASLLASRIVDENVKLKESTAVEESNSLCKQIIPLASLALANALLNPSSQV